jgi:hypothetical protein
MAEINIVIKAANKAGAIFAKVREDAIKMARGISGRPVTINTTSINKNLQATGKEADKAAKKLKDMAGTPMGGLVASIGKVGKALAGLAVAGVVVAGINKIKEWREAWQMALERVAAAEVDFQKKIADAAKGDLPARRQRQEAEMEARIEGMPEKEQARERLAFRQETEVQGADEKIAALQAELNAQIAISAAATAAKESLSGLSGSWDVAAATMGKELGEIGEVFSAEAGGGGMGALMVGPVVRATEDALKSGPVSADMGAQPVTAAIAPAAAAIAQPTAAIAQPVTAPPAAAIAQPVTAPPAATAIALAPATGKGGTVEKITDAAHLQRIAAQRGIADSRPVLERHERKEQERGREIAVTMEELDAAKRAKTELIKKQAAELEKQGVIEANAARLKSITTLEKAVEHHDEMAAKAADLAGQWKEAAQPGGKQSELVTQEIANATNPLQNKDLRDISTQGADVRSKFIAARTEALVSEKTPWHEAARQAQLLGGQATGPRAVNADRMVRVNDLGQETLLKTGRVMKKSEAEILALKEKERRSLAKGGGPRLSRAELIKLRNAEQAQEAGAQLDAAQKAQQELHDLRVQAGIDAKTTAINTGLIRDLLIDNLVAR